ncbi:MAG: response regulator [Pseudomonadota bacterium]
MRPTFCFLENLQKKLIDGVRSSDYNVFAVGAMGSVGHPLFWLWWTFVAPQPYEDLKLRIIGTILCFLLLLKNHWPKRLKRFFYAYWFCTVLYTLPFFFTYYLIASHYSTLWSMGEMAVAFFIVTVVPGYLIQAINIGLGVLLAIGYAYITIPSALYFDQHLFLFVYLPALIFATTAAVIFSYSNLKGHLAQGRTKVLQALAASIAHEMRNPMSQIKYSLDTIGHTLPAPTTTACTQVPTQELAVLYQQLAQGQIAIKRGLQVIAMTLDEVSAKPIDASNFSYLSAAKTTQQAVDEYSYESENERQKIKVVVFNDFTFKGNETSYLFVLFNLIKNALYYFKQRPDASITITIDRPNVIVRDTGPGIPKQLLAQLFQAFKTSGKSDGTGLGLAYCQRAMQAFGGSITCASVLGEYTTFTLSFSPVAQAELDAHRAQLLHSAQVLFKGKRILIVDDSTTQRAATRHMLQGMDCLLDEAENGQLALNQLQKTHYDLIVIDLNMPALDAYATTEKIRAGVVPRAKLVPIVASTNESAHMASVKTQKVGMNGFVSKACSQLELIEVLQEALKQAEQQTKIEAAADVLTGKTILIADDVDINRKIAGAYAARWGMKIVEASHGAEVLELLINQGIKVDIVLMDMEMPGLSGMETTRTIRAQARYQNLPILALTGNFSEGSIQSAHTSGMNDFISKPFEADVLREKLSQQLT